MGCAAEPGGKIWSENSLNSGFKMINKIHLSPLFESHSPVAGRAFMCSWAANSQSIFIYKPEAPNLASNPPLLSALSPQVPAAHSVSRPLTLPGTHTRELHGHCLYVTG